MDISSLYTDMYSTQIKNAESGQYKNKVSSKDYSKASDEELMEVCKDFESYFVEQILKQAMETFTQGDESSSGAMSTLQSYNKDNLIKEYASTITENQNLGLAKTLYEQMKRNYSTDSIKPADLLAEASSEAAADTTASPDTTSAAEAVSTTVFTDEDL